MFRTDKPSFFRGFNEESESRLWLQFKWHRREAIGNLILTKVTKKNKRANN